VQVQLTYVNQATGESQQTSLSTPIALGTDPSRLPNTIEGQPAQTLVLRDAQMLDYHASLTERGGQLSAIAQPNGFIEVNGRSVANVVLGNGDTFTIGGWQVTVQIGPGEMSLGEMGCDRQVGFLFKRRCGRTDPRNCPDCSGAGQSAYDDDYAFYRGYGYYNDGYWGHRYYDDRDRYGYNSQTGNVDFTDADSVSFMNESDTDYEQDMGAS
jgi:hypothetical protein